MESKYRLAGASCHSAAWAQVQGPNIWTWNEIDILNIWTQCDVARSHDFRIGFILLSHITFTIFDICIYTYECISVRLTLDWFYTQATDNDELFTFLMWNMPVFQGVLLLGSALHSEGPRSWAPLASLGHGGHKAKCAHVSPHGPISVRGSSNYWQIQTHVVLLDWFLWGLVWSKMI
jgi:hypothetical protein